MRQVNVKGMFFDAEVAPLLPRMDSVNGHREALQRLQDNWDHLTLLGQMSGIAADITATGDEFKGLSGKLLNTLAHRLLGNVVQALQGKAQVAIDILVRNLFERTADVGFLATDTAVRQALQGGLDAQAMQHTLAGRFQAYVAKYSVYDDVIVLGTDGQVLARLDERAQARQCRHRLLADTLRGQQAFVECFDALDVLDGRRGLVYAAPIHSERGPLMGALALSFKLDDEMAGIFSHLIEHDPFQVLLLCDAHGEVIACSDAWRIPVGARLAIDPDHSGHQCISFAGRIYVAVATRAHSYQGYSGPGWLGCALVPLDNAFDATLARAQAPDAQATQRVDASAFFDEALQAIPRQAGQIQQGLARSVWNWELHTWHQRSDDAAGNQRFAAALLQQVSLTGERIRQVFEQAIVELGESVAASVLHDASFRASLAIDIMDRNLYERANDCRWWSLDGSLREALTDRSTATQSKACEVLSHINSLYTVYTRLVLLDTQGEVVASSGPDAPAWLGRRPDLPWLASAMQMGDHQAWVKSGFEPSPLYDEQHTYVYAAAIHDDARQVLGAIAIVFDSAPQFAAMLRDALLAQEAQAGHSSASAPRQMSAVFMTRAGQVVASTDARFQVGAPLPLPPAIWAPLQAGQTMGHVVQINGMPHAAGISMSAGYREYRGACTGQGDDVLAMVLLPIHPPTSDTDAHSAATRVVLPPSAPAASDRTLATFLCASQHLGIDADQMVEALAHRQITAMPGSPAYLSGLTLHQGKMLPVLDLRALRGQAPAPLDGSPRLLVVCRSSEGFGLALLVDELAGILSVPLSAQQPLPEGMAQHDPAAVAIVRSQRPHGPMLTVLDVDQLAACLYRRRAA
jgi:chemotaxis signal transduction protein